tara:strand:+ start:373 stop:552 length:180 start_codon:yes stop_codon:yes gene_type:complete
MIFTNAKYFKSIGSNVNESIQVEINSVISSVPLDPDNSHYAEIMRQVDAGELTIEPADE